jgi:hypothetical protein
MDRDRFDALARLLATSRSRRVTLGALLGVLAGPTAAEAARKRRKARGKDKDRDRNPGGAEDREREQRLQAERRKGGKRRKPKKKRGGRGNNGGGQTPPPPPDGCCGTDSCPDPEPGSTHAGCNHAGRSFIGQDHNGSTFRGIDGRNANFAATDNHGSVFAEACLQGASFRRARLDGSTWGDACLFDADFTGADFGGDLTLFDNARFCNTTMPDGSVNDRDCGEATPCCQPADPGPACQTPDDCPGQRCRSAFCTNGQCTYTIVDNNEDPSLACGPNSSGWCCEGECCAAAATECGPDGLCCAPNCAGRECGPDGCGATCIPGCELGQTCGEDGRCTGVPTCNPQLCPNGCCLSAGGEGICLTGKGDDFCGSGGVECADCGAGASCIDQVCVCRAEICDGCCENGPGNPGRCLANTPPTCGVGGAQCTSCPTGDGRTCNAQGECVCTPQSCPNGCCDENGECRSGNTSQVCGTGGQACARCPAGQGCRNGVCACTPQSCPDGCCASDGTCQPGNAFGACGVGGNACAGCNDSQTCQDQQCVNCGNSTCICTGQSLCTAPGASNLECSGPSDPNACFCYVSRTGQPFCAGGEVQAACNTDADCRNIGFPGAVCVDGVNVPGQTQCAGSNFCVIPCCTPDCAGKVCGPDGCGGNCGTCPGALVCNASGQCVSTCTPQNCPSGCCAADGSCQPGTAKGACGKGGATCQACGAGEGCLERQCEPCVVRTCAEAGVQCGPTTDGCGATLQCGSCPLGDEPSCQDGECRACDDACPDLCNTCFQVPDGNTICASNAVVGCPLPCSSDADCGNDDFPTCLASAVQRDSGEAQTFADFCQTPGVVGVCVAVASCCQPDCTGKVCGDDGCGGSCGSCAQCQECQNGTCQTTGMVCGNICCALTNEFCCTDVGSYCCDNSEGGCCQGTCCA